WLLMTVFWPIVAGVFAGLLGDPGSLAHAKAEVAFARISPNMIFGEVTLALLNPTTRTLGPVVFSQLEGAVMGNPLPLGVSLLLVWPHLSGLVAATLLLFAGTYVIFQRQEVRA
ncbi:MAG: ABC transporter permease, partial [Spirochaetaceae bacterium]